MIIDKQTEFDNALTLTVTANSTNIYDAGAQGDAIGSHSWFEVNASTKLDSASHTATLVVTLETADDSSFSTNKTVLLTSPTLTAPISGFIYRALIPIGVRRYLRAVYTNGTEAFNAGAIDARIVSEVDDQLNY
jgi:Bbp16-like protein